MLISRIITALACLTLFACKESASSEKTGGTSGAVVGRCFGVTADDTPVRCKEYRGTNAAMVEAARSACGQEKGYTWSQGACPTTQRVGSCVYDPPTAAFSYVDWWYAPTYSEESARDLCTDMEGEFTKN